MENKDYEDFISTISHELRTPLTSIRGFSQTMLTSWDKIDDNSKKKFLNIIVDQSNRLINLVENMLAVTKLQNTKDNLIYREFAVKPVIETTTAIVKNQYKDKIFEILQDNQVTPVLADKDKFQQIMTNLIENAAKYGDENSTIKIEIRNKNDQVSVKVINHGPEIPEDCYEKIFNKFSRIDSPLTRKVQGSGLGLYITKNLTKKMGGTISVKSGNNITTFELCLPCANIEKQARDKCRQ